MDFGKIDIAKASDQGSIMQVVDPFTGEDVDGCTMTIAGKDSSFFRDQLSQFRKKRLNSKNKLTMSELAEAEDEAVKDATAACVLAWTGFEWDGKPLECKIENVKKIFQSQEWLLTEQVLPFMKDRSNLLKKANKS